MKRLIIPCLFIFSVFAAPVMAVDKPGVPKKVVQYAGYFESLPDSHREARIHLKKGQTVCISKVEVTASCQLRIFELVDLELVNGMGRIYRPGVLEKPFTASRDMTIYFEAEGEGFESWVKGKVQYTIT